MTTYTLAGNASYYRPDLDVYIEFDNTDISLEIVVPDSTESLSYFLNPVQPGDDPGEEGVTLEMEEYEIRLGGMLAGNGTRLDWDDTRFDIYQVAWTDSNNIVRNSTLLSSAMKNVEIPGLGVVHADYTFVISGDSLQANTLAEWDGFFDSIISADLGSGLFGPNANILLTDLGATTVSQNDMITDYYGLNWLNGGAGADNIHGLGGNDKILGGKGRDTLYGGAGDDILQGGAGADILVGGKGADQLRGGKGFDLADYSGASRALILSMENQALNAGAATGDVLTSIEAIRGTGRADDITGNIDRNELRGLNGADTLTGGGGKDRIFGGRGNDVIEGGTGTDRMTGNRGADTFVFSSGDGDDFVTDFSQAQDSLRISNAGSVDVSIAGGNTVIDYGSDDSITLLGVQLAQADITFDLI